jgi:predicted Zn finger-like uncharacterized protein
MRIFLSWSGDQSLALAEALDGWLPLINPAFDVWFSRNISPGERWNEIVHQAISESAFGIVCVTPNCLQSSWLMFEAGALTHARDHCQVVPYLALVNPSDLEGTPLGFFQSKKATRQDTLDLILALNASLGDSTSLPESRIHRLFEKLWPELEDQILKIASIPERNRESGQDFATQVLNKLRELDRRQGELTVRTTDYQDQHHDVLAAIAESLTRVEDYIFHSRVRRPQGGSVAPSLPPTSPGSPATSTPDSPVSARPAGNTTSAYCANCGTPLRFGATECPKCGFVQGRGARPLTKATAIGICKPSAGGVCPPSPPVDTRADRRPGPSGTFGVECPGCKAPYQVDARRIPSSGLKMRCTKCATSFMIERPTAQQEDDNTGSTRRVAPLPSPPEPEPAPARPSKPAASRSSQAPEWSVMVDEKCTAIRTLDELMQLIVAGAVVSDTPVRKEGMAQYASALDFPELRPHLEAHGEPASDA